MNYNFPADKLLKPKKKKKETTFTTIVEVLIQLKLYF